MSYVKRSVILRIVILTAIAIFFYFNNIFEDVSRGWKFSTPNDDFSYEGILNNIRISVQDLRDNVKAREKNLDKTAFTQIQDIIRQLMNVEGFELPYNNRSFDLDEKLRRDLNFFVKELWLCIRAQEKKFTGSSFPKIQDIHRNLKQSLIKLRQAAGHEIYRANEIAQLSSLTQNRLYKLQNPETCETRKRLKFRFSPGCGFACSLHEVFYALLVGYATGRTVILEPQYWRYKNVGWDKIFLPLITSKKCNFSDKIKTVDVQDDNNENHTSLLIKNMWLLKSKPEYSVPTIPSEIANRLVRAHGEPHIWWVGQFLLFLFKFQPKVQQAVQNKMMKWNRSCPTVGIHVRRTDKLGWEAKSHSLKDYMNHVEEYFSVIDKIGFPQGCGNIWRVYIASDDAKVITEAKLRYPAPKWEIIGDTQVANSARPKARKSFDSIIGTIADLLSLSETDFLVCTFSSNMCRVAYELMQTKHADASNRFISLDTQWIFYHISDNSSQLTTIPHQSRNDKEIELEIGDEVTCMKNFYNGIALGVNMRTNKTGFYPSYKVRPLVKRADFPKVKWW